MNLLSLRFSSKCAFIFLTVILPLFLLKDWGKEEDFETVSWKAESGFAKWRRAPLEANYYDGSYRSPGGTWKH